MRARHEEAAISRVLLVRRFTKSTCRTNGFDSALFQRYGLRWSLCPLLLVRGALALLQGW
jgi:hypothetical protein